MQNTLFDTTEEDKNADVKAVNVQRLVSKPVLLHGDCRKYLFDFIEADSIDLTVTSPPYDNLRTYNNSSTWGWAEFSAIASGLWRVTEPGGVVVWVVGDATIKGSETGTSFEQALTFKKMGFNLHDTMIWKKPNPMPLTHNRYEQCFEYMFVFSKGKPKSWNPIMVECKKAGTKRGGTFQHYGDGVRHPKHTGGITADMKQSCNMWEMANVSKGEHPAPFPEQLVHDHIISWSNEGDTVFDPLMGSGTTGKMAKLLGRKFIGIELDEEYYQIATKRIEAC